MQLKFNLNYKIEKKKTLSNAEKVLFFAMLKMQELAVRYVPVDTSRLINSIKIFPTSIGFKEYLLYTDVEYAEGVEYGTEPHVVKVEDLEGWSGRVLGDKGQAGAVADKIAKKGTNEQPYFRPALKQVKDIWVARLWEKYL